MGMDSVQFHVDGLVSNHNSEQDKIDRELWTLLRRRVEEILIQPEFDSLNLSWGGFNYEDLG